MAAVDDFLRRYATSPIHVPRLERLLLVYSDGGADDAFASRFIEWDRACPDGEAARIVSEILCDAIDDNGRMRRLSDAAVKGAIQWIARGHGTVSDRVTRLRDVLCSPDAARVEHAADWLATAGADSMLSETLPSP
jgi:hypothetical protein